jgi:hypothetical protein
MDVRVDEENAHAVGDVHIDIHIHFRSLDYAKEIKTRRCELWAEENRWDEMGWRVWARTHNKIVRYV